MANQNGHGGRRPGSGPKRKPVPTPIATDYDAEAYLTAVVCGREPADPHRIAAARTLIGYQRRRSRGRAPSPTTRELAAADALGAEKDAVQDWEQRSAAIRARHGRR